MKNYDPECGMLARHFLSDDLGYKDVSSTRVDSLAQHIQNAINDWFSMKKSDSDLNLKNEDK